MCEKCERSLAGRKQLCPFRSISNDHCEEYEAIERELKAFSILKEAYHCKIFWVENNLWVLKYDCKKDIAFSIMPGDEGLEFFITEEQYKLLKEVLESEA